MGYLTALGTVRRHGQWRLRRELRYAGDDGRLDTGPTGLMDFGAAARIDLSVWPLDPIEARLARPDVLGAPAACLAASTADGSLRISNPGVLEALFAPGWSQAMPVGFYEVRILLTLSDGQVAEIDRNPVRLV